MTNHPCAAWHARPPGGAGPPGWQPGLPGHGLGGAAPGRPARIGARLQRLPLALPGGLLLAGFLEWQRRRDLPAEAASDPQEVRPALPASLGAGLGVSGSGRRVGVRRGAAGIGSSSGRIPVPGCRAGRAPGDWPGHVAVLSGRWHPSVVAGDHAMRRIESAAIQWTPRLRRTSDGSSFVIGRPRQWKRQPACSLGGASAERAGRHVITPLAPAPGRPAGRLPGPLHPTVTGLSAIASTPCRSTSASTCADPAERVELALAEMDRTGVGALASSCSSSPTGTGYVNYCRRRRRPVPHPRRHRDRHPQYSKRPSPLSLGKVAVAREQNRLLWSRIASRVRDLPPPSGPGSCSSASPSVPTRARTSSSDWGTLGRRPWHRPRAVDGHAGGQRLDAGGHRAPRPTSTPTSWPSSTTSSSSVPLDGGTRNRLHYVLLSHDNDGVTKFGTDLIIRRPASLGRERPRGEDAAPVSPRGVPPDALASRDDVLPDAGRHEERADAGRLQARPTTTGPTCLIHHEVYGLGHGRGSSPASSKPPCSTAGAGPRSAAHAAARATGPAARTAGADRVPRSQAYPGPSLIRRSGRSCGVIIPGRRARSSARGRRAGRNR